MLGRSVGISEDKLAAVLADPLPEGLYTPAEAAIVVFARKSTKMEPIDDETWSALAEHFDNRQIIDIVFTVGLNQMISRLHAAVRTDVDELITESIGTSCPVRLPPMPGRT
jgi:alkylhydroperoxidase family enzyme